MRYTDHKRTRTLLRKFFPALTLVISVLALVFAGLSYHRDLPSEEFRRMQDDQMKRMAAHAYSVLLNSTTIRTYEINVKEKMENSNAEGAKLINEVWKSLSASMQRDLRSDASILSSELSRGVSLGLTEDLVGTGETSLADLYSFKATLGSIADVVIGHTDRKLTTGNEALKLTFEWGILQLVCFFATDQRSLFADERQIARLNEVFSKYSIKFPPLHDSDRKSTRQNCQMATFSGK